MDHDFPHSQVYKLKRVYIDCIFRVYISLASWVKMTSQFVVAIACLLFQVWNGFGIDLVVGKIFNFMLHGPAEHQERIIRFRDVQYIFRTFYLFFLYIHTLYV